MTVRGRTLSRALDALDGAVQFANAKLTGRGYAVGAVTGAASFVFALRLMAMGPVPAGGIDYGHYLATAHWLMGQEPTQFGNEGLPGYALLLAPLILMFPEPTATVVAGPLVASILVPATYFLARAMVRPLPSLACGLLVGLQQNISDMIAWGGNPNLLAMAFSLVAWRFVIELASPTHASIDRRRATMGGTFLGLVVLTHSFTAFVTIATIVPFVMATLAFRLGPTKTLVGHALIVAAVAAVVALPAAPMYLTHLQSASVAPAADAADPFSRVAKFAAYLFRDTPLLWGAAAVLAGGAAAVLALRRDPRGLFLGAALIMPLAFALTLFAGLASRTLYYLDAPLVLGFAVAAAGAWQHRGLAARLPKLLLRPGIVAGVVAVTLVLPASSYEREVLAVEFYNKLTADHLEALGWLREHSNRSDAAWTTGSQALDPEGRSGQPYGFWIQGYARRPALYTASPEDLAFDYQHRAAADAVRILQGDLGAENGALRLGVGTDLSVPGQPSIGVRSGMDYRPIIQGKALGLEAGALTYWLDNGVTSANSSYNQSVSSAFFISNVTFRATNNWSGGARSSTALNGLWVTYHVDATGDRFALPWIHKEFKMSPKVEFLGNTSASTPDVPEFAFSIGGAAAADPQAFTVSFAAPSNNSRVNVSVRDSSDGPRLNAVVSGRSPRPQLQVTFKFEGGEARLNGGAAPVFFDAIELMAKYSVRFLFIESLQGDLVKRFQLQPLAYSPVFSNSAAVLFQRNEAPPT